MSKLSIADWTEYLKDTIPCDCVNQRPFVCGGFSNPSDCDIIIIGNNPATQLGKNWWKYWNEKSGFQHQLFADDYSKKGGSKTRKFFDYIKAKGFNCIETNIYRHEGKSRPRICNLDCVQKLIINIPRLTGIIAHGRYARKCLWAHPYVKIYKNDHFQFKTKGRTDAKIEAELDQFCTGLKELSH